MKSLSKETYRIFWKHAARYPFAMAVVVGGVLITTFTDVIKPFFYRGLFDALAGNAPDQLTKFVCSVIGTINHYIFGGASQPLDQYHTSVYLVWGILLLSLIHNILWRTIGLANNFFQPRVMSDLLASCYRYMAGHSYSFFNRTFIGSVTNRIRRYSTSFETIADQLCYEIGRSFLRCIVVLSILFWRHWALGAAMLPWMVAYLVFSYRYSNYKYKYDLATADHDTTVTAQIADSLTNQVNIKLFSGRHREIEALTNLTEQLFRLRKKSWDMNELGIAIQGVFMMILEIGMLVLFLYFWRRKMFTIGDFALLQGYMGQMFEHLWGVGVGVRKIFEARANANEMTEMLETPHEVTDISHPEPVRFKRGAVSFRNIWFGYNPHGSAVPSEVRKLVLEDFNLDIRPGEKVAFVGYSGEGKSTLTRLLLRFVKPQQGSIFIDGQNIARVAQDDLREKIAYVPQDPILFHRSIRENIRYSKPNATDAEVESAASAAHCHEFIMQFPQGYDTLVGERGVNLSGGERQRVAIARAILMDAPILVLDEATSSLDPESEMLIQQALANLIDHKTTITIAHRLSTIREVDRVVVIDKGGIAEQGSPDELLQLEGGIYRKLWRIQHDWLEHMLSDMSVR